MDNGASSYRRFLDGDDSGIADIVREYKDGLTLYLNSFVCNIHIAEEITEDTFFKLIIKKPRYNPQYSFKTWLYTVGRNAALDYLRKSQRRTEVPFEDFESVMKDEETLEASYIREEQKRAVHKALKKLSPEYQQILYLVYFEDFDNSQSSKIMKKSKRQIENLLYRAKLSLKKELNKEGFIYEEL